MKKTKIIALLMIVVLAVSLMSSCSLFGIKKVSKLIDKNGVFEPKNPASKADEIYSLEGFNFSYILNTDLAVFSNSESYAVYNMATDSTKTIEKKSVTEINVGECGDVCYFYVTRSDTSVTPTTYSTTLYDADGDKIDEVDGAVAPVPNSIAGIVRFADKYFFVHEGALVAPEEISAFKTVPGNIIAANDEFYFTQEDTLISAYDMNFDKVASYEIPEYAAEGDHTLVPLPGSKLLIQYSYLVDEMSDDYDYMESELGMIGVVSAKGNLVTVILNPNSGKAKEIKCDYIINDYQSYTEKEMAENLLNDKYWEVVVTGAKIENKRIATTFIGSINKNGKIKEFPRFEGEVIDEITAVAEDRWTITTDANNKYLIDSKGDLMARLDSSVKTYGNYLERAGKFYDYNLEELYNYRENGYEIYSTATIGGNVVLTDGEGKLMLFSGTKKLKTIDEGSSSDNKSASIFSNCYIVYSSPMSSGDNYEVVFYNEVGSVIKTITDDNYISVSTVFGSEDHGSFFKVEIDSAVRYFIVK